jgi:hypothetical protein
MERFPSCRCELLALLLGAPTALRGPVWGYAPISVRQPLSRRGLTGNIGREQPACGERCLPDLDRMLGTRSEGLRACAPLGVVHARRA